MELGYDGKLYILAFDHRGSFQKKMFGIEGDPTAEQTETIADAKRLIFEGMLVAVGQGADPASSGVLVDEQFGSDIPRRAREHGLKLAMPVERSGQELFDFEYGDDFGEHILRYEPDFSKVLVRYNPEGDADGNADQMGKLKRLSDWLHERDRKFLFELLVPAEPGQLESVEGDVERYEVELRPQLMRETIAELQDGGVEPDIWKIEGVETQDDAAMIERQTRAGGRDGVACVLLGRGADAAKVDHWLRVAAPVDGFIGFAIGRTIWWDALKAYLAGELERPDAAQRIADSYLRFIDIYARAAATAAVS